MYRIALITAALFTSTTAFADPVAAESERTLEAPSEAQLWAEYDDIVLGLEESVVLAEAEAAEPVREFPGEEDPTIYAMAVTVCHDLLGCFNVMEVDDMCCADVNLSYGSNDMGNGWTAHCFD